MKILAENDYIAKLRIIAENDEKSMQISINETKEKIKDLQRWLKDNPLTWNYKDRQDELKALQSKLAKQEAQLAKTKAKYDAQILKAEQRVNTQSVKLAQEAAKQKEKIENEALRAKEQALQKQLKMEMRYQQELLKGNSQTQAAAKKQRDEATNAVRGASSHITAVAKQTGNSDLAIESKALSAQYKEELNYQKQKLLMQNQMNQAVEQERALKQMQNENYKQQMTLMREIQSNESKIISLGQQKGSQSTKEINQLKEKTLAQINELKAIQQVVPLTKQQEQAIANAKKQQAELTKETQRTANEMKNASSGAKSFSEYLKNVGNYVLLYNALNAIQSAVRNAYEVIVELDTAFTDIQMVTGYSESQIGDLSVEYNELAKQMGATTQEVAEGATEWLRQGKSIEETTSLLKSSMTLSKVGAMESAEATELLTSTLNGYKYSAEEAMGIVDKVSAIDMAAATSSEELMTALSRTANSADDAGISFDKLLAMIGTVSSVTRKSASTIGESFKTIFSRMSNVAAGKDIDDEGETLNDVEETLERMGIALRDSQYEWRNFEDVLDEVAEKWDAFNNTQQSQIATAIAGTRQQENFRALMNNWDQVTQLVDVSANSAGSATQKMEVYLDSLQAKLNEVKAAWEGFLLSLNQNESIKGMLDFVIFLINNLPQVISLVISLATAFKAFETFSTFQNKIKSIDALNQILAALTGTTQTNTTQTEVNTIATTANTKAKELNNKTVTSGAQAMQGASKITATFSTVMSGLSLGIGLATTAFSLIQTAILSYEHHMDSLKTSVQDAASAIEDIQGDIDSLDSAIGKVTEINTKVNEGEMTSQQRAQELDNIKQNLISTYGEEAEALDLVNSKYDEQISQLNNLKESSLYQQLQEIQKVKGDKEELLNRNVDTVMGDEENFYGLSSDTRLKVFDIAQDNNMQLTERIFADQMSLVGKAEDQVKVYKEMLDLQDQLNKEGKNSDAQRIANMLEADSFGGVFGLGKNIGMKEEYEKSGGDSLDILYDNSEEEIQFQLNAEKQLSEYRSALEERNSLSQQFNDAKNQIDELQQKKEEAKTKKEKDTLDTQIKNLEAGRDKYYDLLVKNNDKVQQAYQAIQNIIGDNTELQDFFSEMFADYDTSTFYQTAPEHLDKLKDSMAELYPEVKNLDDAFEKGQINTKQYFDTLNGYINNLDVSKANQNLDSLKQSISAFAGNNLSYFDTFMGNLLGDTLPDGEDVTNLQAYTSNVGSLINMLKEGNAAGGAWEGQIDSTLFGGDGLSSEERENEINTLKSQINEAEQALAEYKTQREELKTKEYDVSGGGSGLQLPWRGKYSESGGVLELEVQNSGEWKEISQGDGAFGAYEDAFKDSGAKQYEEDVKEIDKTVSDTENSIADMNAQIEDLEVGDGLDEYKSQLDELNDVLSDMDISATQDAFDTLADGLDSGAIDDSLKNIELLPEKYKNAFIEVSNDVVAALGSTNEEVRKQGEQSLQNLIGAEAEMMMQTVDFANLSQDQMEQVATDIANKAIIAQGGVTAALQQFAQEGNAIASTAMGQSVQTLGIMISKIGEALNKIHVSVPVKIPKLQMHVEDFMTGGDLFQMNGTNDSSIEIGGDNVVQGFDELGGVLQNKDYADAIGNLLSGGDSGGGAFTPYSFNPKGKPGSTGDSGKKKSGSGGGGGGKSDADKAAEEAEKLAEDIAEFREDEGTALEDITEELINHYRLEKTRLELQKENLDYANDLLDAEENTTQWIKVQNQLLTNQRKQIQELYRTNSKIEQQMEKIQSENQQYDINSWFDEAGNDTLAYINLINSFAQQERDYRATVPLNSQEDIENAEKYIEQLQKQRDYVENLHDSVSQLKEAWIDNGNELQDLFSEMNDTLKEMRDTLLDKFMTALEDRVDEVNQAYEDNIDRLDSLITVQERYNDVINNSLQTQADLRKELQSNKDSYQYLDDYMRSIIFNEDDYKNLSKELDKVMSDMNALSDEYQYKINNLTEDEMYMLDEITNEYERQVDLKEKEYEILQAQLDVVKARTQLENARNERTVRIFTNGEWQWVKIAAHVKHRKLLGTREAT